MFGRKKNPATAARIFPRPVPPNCELGMSKDQLIANCGAPESVAHQIINPTCHKEQWSYQKQGCFVYLLNGFVSSMQYTDGGERWQWGER